MEIMEFGVWFPPRNPLSNAYNDSYGNTCHYIGVRG